MTSENPVSPPVAAEEYARVWGESTARALGQLNGATFTPTPVASAPPPGASEPPSPAEPAPTAPVEEVSLYFKVSGRLTGDQLFCVSKADGVRLAQMLMAEPLDPSAAFSEGYADALNEIFRQFAGLAASTCKATYGGEVQFSLEASQTVEWTPATTAIWSFAAPQVAPIQWTLLLSPEILAALESVKDTRSPPVPAQTAAPQSAKGAVSGAGPVSVPPAPAESPSMAVSTASQEENDNSNLDLLLDVVLEATLRFGQREMSLRDILELHPGSVVELNRRLQEPAELLVAGRVIAHGDVVIVDGAYGLRITDVAHPHQRLESVETRSA